MRQTISVADLFKVKSLGFMWALHRKYVGAYRVRITKTSR